jgi:hypothetical protein
MHACSNPDTKDEVKKAVFRSPVSGNPQCHEGLLDETLRSALANLVIDVLMSRKHFLCVLLWVLFMQGCSFAIEGRRTIPSR